VAERRTDGAPQSEPWLARLRDVLGGALLDVRVLREGEEVDFLLVHPRGEWRAAIRAFSEIIVECNSIPPFDVRTADRDAADADEYADYVSLKHA
jgi:hypothetical protein